jgi:hypothetical protein
MRKPVIALGVAAMTALSGCQIMNILPAMLGSLQGSSSSGSSSLQLDGAAARMTPGMVAVIKGAKAQLATTPLVSGSTPGPCYVKLVMYAKKPFSGTLTEADIERMEFTVDFRSGGGLTPSWYQAQAGAEGLVLTTSGSSLKGRVQMTLPADGTAGGKTTKADLTFDVSAMQIPTGS